MHRTCLLAVPLLFCFHRHDDVTPSWFGALESHVLRVPNGNGIKSGLHHLLYPHHLCWFGLWLLHGSSILVCIFIVSSFLRIRDSKSSDTTSRGHPYPVDVDAVNSLSSGKRKRVIESA